MLVAYPDSPSVVPITRLLRPLHAIVVLLLSMSRICLFIFITSTYQILFYVGYSSLGTFARHLSGDKALQRELPVVVRAGRVSQAASLAPARLWGEDLPLRPVVGALFLLSASER